jgi:hypothetical protein
MKSYLALFTLVLGLSTIAACHNDAPPQVESLSLSAHQSVDVANSGAGEVAYCGTVRCPVCGYTFFRAYINSTQCRENGPWVAHNGCAPHPHWFCHIAYGVYNLCYVSHC